MLWNFRLRRSCKISVTQSPNDDFPMRCNRKTARLAVTPQRELKIRGKLPRFCSYAAIVKIR
jgi:hypothetical protein